MGSSLDKKVLEKLVHAGKTTLEISKELHTSRGTVLRACDNFKLSRPKIPASPRKLVDETELLKMIKEGKTTGEIAKFFGCTRTPIFLVRKKYGFPLPKRGHARHRKHFFDFRFFENIDTEEKAYILGFVSADGYIHERSLVIKIRVKDASLLEKIANIMHCSFRPRLTHNGADAELAFGNIDMVSDLAKYGIVPKKTFTLKFAKNVPEDLVPHYMRGVMDGDGTIAKKYREASFCSGSKDFMLGFDSWYKNRYGFSPHGYIKATSPNTMYRYFSRKDKRFLDDMYANSKIHLDRKRDRYLKNWPVK